MNNILCFKMLTFRNILYSIMIKLTAGIGFFMNMKLEEVVTLRSYKRALCIRNPSPS